jgi:hypothetical protein
MKPRINPTKSPIAIRFHFPYTEYEEVSPMSEIKEPAKSTPQHVIKTQFGFAEGFNFGCGFFLAGTIFTTIIVPLIILALVAFAREVVDMLLTTMP